VFFARESNQPEHVATYGSIVNPEFIAANGDRLLAVRSLSVGNPLQYKDLPGYKQVLMHNKYLPYIPKEYSSDILYQKTNKEVLESEELDQKKRRANKKVKKETKFVVSS
jgi:hypothetical protein